MSTTSSSLSILPALSSQAILPALSSQDRALCISEGHMSIFLYVSLPHLCLLIILGASRGQGPFFLHQAEKSFLVVVATLSNLTQRNLSNLIHTPTSSPKPDFCPSLLTSRAGLYLLGCGSYHQLNTGRKGEWKSLRV